MTSGRRFSGGCAVLMAGIAIVGAVIGEVGLVIFSTGVALVFAAQARGR